MVFPFGYAHWFKRTEQNCQIESFFFFLLYNKKKYDAVTFRFWIEFFKEMTKQIIQVYFVIGLDPSLKVYTVRANFLELCK